MGGATVKAVILNGSEKGDQPLDTLNELMVHELTRRAWVVQTFMLHEMEIAHCRGCFGCWIQTPGCCVINDAGREVAKAFIQSDLVAFLTPVTFGGYSSELKKALDRVISILAPFFMKIQGEVHHKRRYENYPRLMAVGLLPQPDEESERIFKTLLSRNAINFHAPAYAGGVMLRSQNADEMRERIQTLFDELEVAQ
jgi:multimeric flavodoxin WrbA